MDLLELVKITLKNKPVCLKQRQINNILQSFGLPTVKSKFDMKVTRGLERENTKMALLT